MKTEKLIIITIALVFLIIPLINAEAFGCCEQTDYGRECAETFESSCAAEMSFQEGFVCSSTDFCSKEGTCVYYGEGYCEEGTGKSTCLNGGGDWVEKSLEEISTCSEGCCFVGEGTMYVTQIDCSRYYDTNSLSVPESGEIWRGDVGRLECNLQSNERSEGACIFEEVSTNCRRLTKSECETQGGNFKSNFLCTGAESEGNKLSQCTKTTNTICHVDGDSYFLDSCGNRANVYDKSKETNQEYWNTIQDPFCDFNGDSATCGNCNYNEGSKCETFSKENPNMPSNPERLDNVCVSLDCQDDYFKSVYGRQPMHGEEWCVGTEGTIFPLEIDLDTGLLLEKGDINGLIQKIALEDYDKYNVPGSMYSVRYCSKGEVKTQECDPFRESICKEGKEPNVDLTNREDPRGVGYRQAECHLNRYQTCASITDKADCEDELNLDCKWLYGYRYDGQLLNTPQGRNEEEQGVCLPLYTPGVRFWEPEGGAEVCGFMGVEEEVKYQMGIWNRRSEFNKVKLEDTSNFCFENCYAIPYYGCEFTEEGKYSSKYEDLTSFWEEGNSLPTKLKNLHLSTQKAYYCHHSSDDDKAKLGSRPNKKEIACLDFENKRQDIPLFYTNEEFLDYLRERARSVGDCGYKQNIFGEGGSRASELMISNLVKVGQKGEAKKEFEPVTIFQGFDTKYYLGDKELGGDAKDCVFYVSEEEIEVNEPTEENTYSCTDLDKTYCAAMGACQGDILSGETCGTGTECCSTLTTSIPEENPEENNEGVEEV